METNTSQTSQYHQIQSILKNHYAIQTTTVLQEFGYFEERKVLLIQSDQGKRIVKLHTGSLAQQRVQSTLELIDRLHRQKYSAVPVLYKTNQGEPFIYEDGMFIYVLEHIPQSPIQPCQAADWWRLGEAAGKLNRIQSEPIPFEIPVDLAIQEILAWSRGTDYEIPIQNLVPQLDPLVDDGETGVIHAEINPSNAGKRADGSIALLDWDEAGTGRRSLELGYPFITQFLHVVQHTFEMEHARAFYAGYRSALPGAWNKNALFAAALFHAIRYMRFADTEIRWQRILYAVNHRSLLLACLDE